MRSACWTLPAAVVGGLILVAPAWADTETIRGRVTARDATAGSLTVKTGEGKDVALAVTPDTRLEAEGKPIPLAQFKEGQRVRATYEATGGVNRLVSLRPTAAGNKVSQELGEAVRAVKDYAYKSKEEYQRKMRDALERVDDRIDELEDRAREGGAEARARVRDQVQELKQKRTELSNRLEKGRPATEDAWNEVKSGVSRAADDLQRALDQFRDG